MDDPPVMALEEQQSSEFHEAPKLTVEANSIVDESPTSRDITFESLTDTNVENQTLELKNGGNIDPKFCRRSLSKLNRFSPVQISKCGPRLVPNRKKCVSVTEKDPSEEPSTSTSSSKYEMNGGDHVSDQANLENNDTLIKHLLNASDNPEANSHDISVLKVRSFSGPAFNFDSSPVSPSHLVYPYSAPLPVSKDADLPRIIKHKPSSITFADYDSFLNLIQSVNESSDTCETSSEDEGPDVVFPKMTKEVLACSRWQRAGFDKQRRKGACGQAGSSISTSSYEAEEDSSSTEESPQVQSPLSESMIQLMRRLDQLNMDIEEALSAGSSPSDTPNTARRHLAMMNDESTLQSRGAGVKSPLDCNSMARRTDPRERNAHERLTKAGTASYLGRSHGKKIEMSIKKRSGAAGSALWTLSLLTLSTKASCCPRLCLFFLSSHLVLSGRHW
ncbi:putative stAR-related lipid transfer protein 13 [Triplophysa rosa]|uniref:StAR-related lipid transfer protein 13 n=1 Tax=Triplophysa rosa TaxID=992332 RepID=A0A9W7WJB9_TRIRA|nr:putative stAR-related lipid transfer protein 13 [Triplophysa rosa]